MIPNFRKVVMSKIFAWFVRVIVTASLACSLISAKTEERAYTPEELVSAYIYLLSKNTTWPHDSHRSFFRIGVLEKGGRIRKTLWSLTKDLSLHGRPIWISGYERIPEVEFDRLDVLFVDRTFASKIQEIYRKIPAKAPLLLISKDAQSSDAIMINIYYDSRHRSRIQVNRANIESHGLKISDKILLTGGEEVGVSKLFDASLEAMRKQEARYQHLRRTNLKFEKEIEKYKKRIEKLQRDILEMERRFEKQRLEVEKKARELQNKQRQILKKEKKLRRLAEEYTKLKTETNQQKKKLQERLSEIARQEEEIAKRSEILASQKKHIEELDFQIEAQKRKIEKQSEIIESHKTLLKEKNVKIEKQEIRLYLLLVIIVLLLFFAIYIYRNKKLLESLTEKLKEAKENAEYAYRSKSTFLTNMSHELRTPLNAILGFSDLLLKDETLGTVQKNRLEIIHRSGSFLLTLINDVLNLARVESGKIKIEKEPVDVGMLIRDVVVLMEQRAETKGLKIRIDQSSRFPRCIVSDGDKIRQILLNYLSNAVKYSEKGEILLKLDADERYLHMQVKDQGVGISSEDLPKIFEPFTQVGGASERTGTGLGLSITREFVEAMGGRVWVESEPGKGSVFHATIRYEECKGDENDVLKEEGLSEVIGLSANQKSVKVLIVEDKEDNRLLLRSILEILGIRIEEAKDGMEAVEKFQRWRPDFIWMDRRMPRMDGEEATRRIRSLPGGKNVVIVALTASAFTDEKEKVMSAGMDGFVVKPYSPVEIYETMKKFLDLHFIYRKEESETAEEQPSGFSMAEYVETLSSLNGEELDLLYDAAVLLDTKALENVLAKMEKKAPLLVEMTRRLADRLEYHRILEAIEKIRSERKT